VKVAILAGGVGSRLAEETESRPKPMVEIGEEPIIWHIMKHYAHYGLDEFVIALGYKGHYIKKYFMEYCSLTSDLTVRFKDGVVESHRTELSNWTVDLVDTGLKTQTGGRIKRLADQIGRERFLLTWGDGVSNVDIAALVRFHESHGRLATMTAVRPPARFGHLELSDEEVVEFSEKPQTGEGWINGAFFVLEPEVFDYIDGDEVHFEREPLERLAKDRQLMAYRHHSFWQCMDTLRDRRMLQELWESGDAPWKTWS